MATRKPLVVNNGGIEQLQTADLLGATVDKFHLMHSLFTPGGYFVWSCFGSYDSMGSFTSGSGSLVDNFGASYVRTGITLDSAARRHVNNIGWYFTKGITYSSIYFLGYTTDVLLFYGISQALLTNLQFVTYTGIHAGLFYKNNVWYASVANGAAQTVVNVTADIPGGVATGRLEIDGADESGHVKFRLDGVEIADISTNVPPEANGYGYFQWYANNKSVAVTHQCAVFSVGYVQ